MTTASFLVSAPTTPSNSGGNATTWLRDRVTEVRALLANAGWVLVSGTAGKPAQTDVATFDINLTNSPWSGSNNAVQTVATDYYTFPDANASEFYVAVLHRMERSGTGGPFLHCLDYRAGTVLGAGGFTGSTFTVTNASTLSSNYSSEAYMVHAVSLPGYLAIWHGGRRSAGTITTHESFFAAERVCDSAGTPLTAADAGVAVVCRKYLSDSSSTAATTIFATARHIDNTVVQTSSGGFQPPGPGMFTGPYFPVAAYAGNLPLLATTYWTTRPGYGRYLFGLHSDNAPPGSFTAKNPLGAANGTYRVHPQTGNWHGWSGKLTIAARWE
jgi:hypothetical protein